MFAYHSTNSPLFGTTYLLTTPHLARLNLTRLLDRRRHLKVVLDGALTSPEVQSQELTNPSKVTTPQNC